MIITQQVYNQLINSPQVPPETGGILGMRNGTLDTVLFDGNRRSRNDCTYTPDTEFFNRIISHWQQHGIRFCGVFHTHALQWPSLSQEDKNYALLIAKAMPSRLRPLYFPLVFPGIYVKSFVIHGSGNGLCITNDNIKII